jgi:hypothetical protein
MNCRGCGTELDPRIEDVNAVVDEVLQQSVDDAVETGGVSPLCGHSKVSPCLPAQTLLFALLFRCFATGTIVSISNRFARNGPRFGFCNEFMAKSLRSA